MPFQALKQHPLRVPGFLRYGFHSNDISAAAFVYSAHDKYRHTDDSAIYANFFIQCVYPQNRIYRTLKWPITELTDLLIETFCHLTDLASGQIFNAETLVSIPREMRIVAAQIEHPFRRD